MLTLTHVSVGVKESIQCIETPDGVSPIRQVNSARAAHSVGERCWFRCDETDRRQGIRALAESQKK